MAREAAVGVIRSPATAMSTTARITIGELEANYQLYCKALKMLIAEQRSLKKIQRTVCWSRLQTLHHCLPRQYKSPDYLYAQLLMQHDDNRDLRAPALA
jgi:hypothetical protein